MSTNPANQFISQANEGSLGDKLIKKGWGTCKEIIKAVLIFALAYESVHHLTGRELKEAEVHELKRVFKDSVDYKAVKVHTLPKLYTSLTNTAGFTFYNSIFVHEEFVKRSFDELSDRERNTVFHEMEHVRGHQNGTLKKSRYYRDLIKHNFNEEAVYSYDDEKFSDMNPEQQAVFIANYAEAIKAYDDGLEEINQAEKMGFATQDGLKIDPGVTLHRACSALLNMREQFDAGFPFDRKSPAKCRKVFEILNDEEYRALPDDKKWKALESATANVKKPYLSWDP